MKNSNQPLISKDFNHFVVHENCILVKMFQILHNFLFKGKYLDK